MSKNRRIHFAIYESDFNIVREGLKKWLGPQKAPQDNASGAEIMGALWNSYVEAVKQLQELSLLLVQSMNSHQKPDKNPQIEENPTFEAD